MVRSLAESLMTMVCRCEESLMTINGEEIDKIRHDHGHVSRCEESLMTINGEEINRILDDHRQEM